MLSQSIAGEENRDFAGGVAETVFAGVEVRRGGIGDRGAASARRDGDASAVRSDLSPYRSYIFIVVRREESGDVDTRGCHELRGFYVSAGAA